uniref:Uncharacterized protein n=1 Tax=viral metagenome TaxID=1070528 RepID=A0A6M3M9F8_9ZZZZ
MSDSKIHNILLKYCEDVFESDKKKILSLKNNSKIRVIYWTDRPMVFEGTVEEWCQQIPTGDDWNIERVKGLFGWKMLSSRISR